MSSTSSDLRPPRCRLLRWSVPRFRAFRRRADRIASDVVSQSNFSRCGALALALTSALAAGLLSSANALAGAVLPESGGSPNADKISDLYEIVLYVGVVVFLFVAGALIYTLVKFRARNGVVAAQIRGNTRLEVGWTAGAALIIVALVVVTFMALPSIQDPAASGTGGLAKANGNLYAVINQPPPPGGQGLTIDVNGQQYIWRFTYPDRTFSYETMVVPIDTTVILKIRAQDVQHSWWIPKLGGKADAVPGYTNETWFKISKAGVYEGQCAELCGRGHANMVSRVRAVTPEQYRSWLASQKKEIAASRRFAASQRTAQTPK